VLASTTGKATTAEITSPAANRSPATGPASVRSARAAEATGRWCRPRLAAEAISMDHKITAVNTAPAMVPARARARPRRPGTCSAGSSTPRWMVSLSRTCT